ncbi:MAG: hypothetical protein RQM92_09775 [Candidatus Syntrophopropionicum ammoniitolerans]
MKIKPVDECAYYLVREMGNLEAPAKEVYFEHMLGHIRARTLEKLGLRPIELEALIAAAKRRKRLEDLDMAVGWRNESVHEG